MGVSGCGKTTIGRLLATALGIPFYDGDDFHPAANVQKMKNGIPLNDVDREPWLKLLNNNIRQWNSTGGAVLACSALKEVYRRILAENALVVFLHLSATKEQILRRLNNRAGHFMPASLLDSQFETLEETEEIFPIEASGSPDEILKLITAFL